MAYQFDKLDELMQQQGQANIFGQAAPQGEQPGQTAMGTGQVKTSTEGALQPAATGSSTPAVQDAPQTQPSNIMDAQKAAYQAAKPQSSRSVAGRVQSQILSQSANQEATADNIYAAGKAKQQYGVDEATIGKAIAKDEGATSKVRDVLNRTTINPLDEFKLPTLNVEDVANLQTDAGLQQLLKRQAGPRYTGGMGAFDVSALRKDPEFFNEVGNVTRFYENLKKREQGLGDKIKEDLTKYGTEGLSSSQQAIKDLLGKRVSEIEAGNVKEAEEANRKREGLLKSGDPDAMRKAVDAAKDALSKKYGQAGNRFSKFVPKAQADLSGYFKVADPYTASQFVSPEESASFGQIMSLLGRGDVLPESVAPVSPYTIDQAGIEAALDKSVVDQRGAADKESKAAIDKIIKAAQDRADLADESRKNLGLYFNKKDINKQAKDVAATLGPDLAKYYIQTPIKGGGTKINPMDFITGDTRDLNAADVLTQEDVDRLTGYQQDLGLNPSYQVGAQGLGHTGQFNESAFKEALLKLLQPRLDAENAYKASRAATPQAAQPWIPPVPHVGQIAIPGDSGVVIPASPSPQGAAVIPDANWLDNLTNMIGRVPSEIPETEEQQALRRALGGTL